ncbi:aldose 1-epimerase [Aquabacterium sp.]|uniref:aldose 1-epimerase n=1 Tax=Aquabacterium sp. TaxID=1872578 RepID=UPI003783E0D1
MSDHPTPVELQAGDLTLALRPDLGGAIAGLWHRGVPVLRSGEAGALDAPGASGGFVMAPYSNRIGFGRFRWQGQDHTLRLNYPGSPHPMHGVAWQRPWQVTAQREGDVELHYAHVADADWPFAFTIAQRVVLTPGGLELHLAVTNTDARPQPMGLGWHPYFPRRSRSRLHAEVAARWETDANQLPTRQQAQPGIDGDIAHLAFDHCFEGWQGAARIRDEKFSLRLSSSLRYLMVYTPVDKDFFCVEPVSHVGNAIHNAEPASQGLRRLEPGQSLDAWVKLEVATI